jgi:serine palmitoyltransferase
MAGGPCFFFSAKTDPFFFLFSYDLATLPSVLPAFAGARDAIVLDDAAPFAVTNGASLSRARVRVFRHGDPADAERALTALASEDRAAKRPPCRRFIVVEGVACHVGDVAPLPAFVALKKKYGARLVVDETHALGALGATGRGACEHHGLAPGDADVVVASLGTALAGVGGFCAASREIVDHQRLSGLGYCFSASLPPFLAVAAHATLDRLVEEGPATLLPALQRNAALLRALAADVPGLAAAGGLDPGGPSPLLHLRLADPPADAGEAVAALRAIAADALSRSGVFFCVASPPPLDGASVPPSLRLTVTAAHSEHDVRRAAAALRAAARRVLGRATATGDGGARPAAPPPSSPGRARSPSAGWAASPLRPDPF